MAKVVRKLREHWKKSTFAAVLGYFGIDYAYDKHKTFLMMREYSQQALVHGKRKLPAGAKNKHITLLLNPTAGNRKSKGKLEKFAEPLLHLSGFLVNTVKTERVDEARDLASLIEKTNIIAIAGGDGTVFETVTGLLRRNDADEAVRRYQIGVIPVGSQNTFGKSLVNFSKNSTDAKLIAESAMAIVNHRTKPVDVMEIKITDDKAEETKTAETVPSTPIFRKPFYSLIGIEMGQYREAKKIQQDLPSFFGQYITTFWALFRVEPLVIKAQLNYIPKCSGCSKCKKEQEQERLQQQKKEEENKKKGEHLPQSSIWGRLMSIFSRPVLADTFDKLEEDLTEIINPECGVEKSICVDSSELNIRVTSGGILKVEIGRKLERTDFMIEGLKRLRGESSSYSNVLECKEIELCPVEGPEFLSIDNEEFEVKKVKLTAIKERINFFVS